jgi:hypothetical protein
MQTLKRYLRVDRREIGYFRFILEGYDGIAILTTLDAREGRVVLRIAPGCEEEVDRLVQNLGKEILIETLN